MQTQSAHRTHRAQPTLPLPEYTHHHQPILSAAHTVIPRPYIQTPRQHDAEGPPWCDCCTSQLSDDDYATPGLHDPDQPSTRYRLRMDQDQPPTHSNQHKDYIRIFRANADYHKTQREERESYQARTGMLPDFQDSSNYINTPDMATIRSTMERLQYERYRNRGGRKGRGATLQDHAFNSPNRANMTPGEPYRKWFHRTISRSHYSLGEATNHYNQWISDPQYGPPRQAPPPALQPTAIPHPHQPLPDTSSSDDEDPTPHPTDRHARAQTIVQDVHTSPDDSNAVLDSGAMMTTAPRRLLLTNPAWENNIHPAPPNTSIRYGNMEIEPVEELSSIGDYQISVVPNRFRTALVCVHDIVSAGHVVTFTNGETIISDLGGAYTLRIPRIPASREWRVPLHLLQRLTDLRAAHPLHHPQHHPDNF